MHELPSAAARSVTRAGADARGGIASRRRRSRARAKGPRARANRTHGLRIGWGRRATEAGRSLALRRGMYRACIAVVDASRARLFTYERSAEPEGLEEHLTEERDLVHPARRRRPAELFADSRPGSSRTGGRQYAFDDHRDAHVDALDAEFSRAVIDEVVGLLRAAHAQRVILCASPRMLGELREAGRELPREGIELDELPRDLVKLTPPRLRAYLASHGLLPARPARSQA